MYIKSSLQHDLDSFYKYQLDFSIRAVSKSTFSHAGSKINPSAFKHLSCIALKVFYEKAPVNKWKGMRDLVCDGTRLILPCHKTIT